ncbi:MAG: CBS domain-containing protein [Rhodocyclaceae bacterium]|jgi:CBS domain-containing protein|nr:CBS domain-containing protein [Rhodocyclaceae bacterium]
MTMSKVEDLMVPVGKFPVISQESTLREAILALDKVEQEFLSGQREQRILLVFDEQEGILGKLTPKDVIRGLEPNYGKLMAVHAVSFQNDYKYVMQSQSLLELQDMTTTSWDNLCAKSKETRIKDFLVKPPLTQLVQVGDSLNKALHRFILGKHHTLFVTEGKKLVGLVRFTDVYREILGRIKYVCCG